MNARHALLALLAIFVVAGCGRKLKTGDCKDEFESQASARCDVDGWEERPYDLVLPDGYDPAEPVPLIVAMHGGGGKSNGAAVTTCRNGKAEHESCLHKLGGREGFAVAYPNGTPSKLLDGLRTWNAGGGEDDWRCTSGKACEDGVDDTQYLNDLLDDIESRVNVDTSRIYMTGLSNGAAMSYRVAGALSLHQSSGSGTKAVFPSRQTSSRSLSLSASSTA